MGEFSLPSLSRWAAPATLDDVFVAHYRELLKWASDFVGPDWTAAEDLVHDTFVRVALSNLDLHAIGNIQGYLFVAMRNVHLSGVRRRMARPQEGAGPLDHDSVVKSLLTIDNHRQRRAIYEDISSVARYACVRKATSKGASALILRFFHGYFPAEVARVLGTTEAAVDSRLRIARSEARSFLAEPGQLPSDLRRTSSGLLELPPDEAHFLAWLRRLIFEACVDPCLTANEVSELYEVPEPIGVRHLAHIVSCPTCLDAVNRRLGIPLLADRDPSDTLGRGDRPKGAKPRSGKGTSSLRLRLDDVLDERPKELRIAVNGLFVGSQVVSSEVSEQRVKILIPERIGFVELFSEFGTCLLYLQVTPPPDGPAVQSTVVELGDRRLVASLTFGEAAPVLDVSYEDPSGGPVRSRARPSLAGRVAPAQAARRVWLRPIWLRRLALATLALAIIGGVWSWAMWRSPTVLAAEILQEAGAVEGRSEVEPGAAAHRQLLFEERRLPDRTVISRKRIEVWQDGSRHVQARRLYDEASHVVAGVWSSPDGTRTMYRAGGQARQEVGAPDTDQVTSANIWMLGPSARDFSSRVGSGGNTLVEVNPTTYLLTYRPTPQPGSGLLEASLTVTRAGHHAMAASFVLREDGETRSYTFTELLSEKLPAAGLRANLFEPDAALLGALPAPVPLESGKISATGTEMRPPVTPNLALVEESELDATYRLYRTGIWLGTTGEVSRTARGVAVRAVVPTADRAAAVNRGFANLAPDAGISLTVDVEPDAPRPGESSSSVAAIPAYPRLQSMFASVESTSARDDAIRTFVERVLERIDSRRDRLSALRTLVERWPEERLRQLRLESIVSWQVMVQAHADAVRRDTELLRVQLAPMSGTGAAPLESASGNGVLSSVGEAAALVREMTTRAADEDAIVRAAFLPCPVTGCGPVDVDLMLRSLAAFEGSVSRFSQFYVKIGRSD